MVYTNWQVDPKYICVCMYVCMYEYMYVCADGAISNHGCSRSIHSEIT